MSSLRTRLLVLWLLSLLACAAVGVVLVQLYQLSSAARVGRAEAVVARGCDLVRERYASYTAGWRGPPPPLADPAMRQDLAAVVAIGLARLPEVEGGIWQPGGGSLAYAYPTYPSEGPKTDLPLAEEARIRAVNAQAARDQQYTLHAYPAPAETLLIEACPLGGPIPDLTAWAMTRVRTALGYGRLGAGLGVLGALVAGGAVWLTVLVVSWSRRVQSIEAGLAGADAAGGIPTLARTGARELDRIVDALNDAGRRLAEQRRHSEALASQVAAAERLAALGRVAAGLAHEIRNPLAAMRLRAENALASADPARPRRALADILDQVARLNGLVSELLAMTQRRSPAPVRLELAETLAALAAGHEEEAARHGVTLSVACPATSPCLDPAIVGRVLDNLLLNALRHTPQGGRVHMEASAGPGDNVRIVVSDTGPGVAPELRGSLFEPFVTGRHDGTGLGLAIARELAAAHGGTLALLRPGGETPGQGAAFALDLPQGPECPPS